MFKIKDKIKVLVGVYKDSVGTVEAIAPDAKKNIGVNVKSKDSKLPLTWFKPNEIEKC